MRVIERDIVGAFIFSNDNKILLGQPRDGGVYEGSWVVPGGGIEKKETKLNAVKREVEEEVGIDISTAKVTPIDGFSIGESNKTLRDTGEMVLVKMKFHDFRIDLEAAAEDVELRVEDDLKEARWFLISQLSILSLAPGTKATLQKLKVLS